MPGDWEIRLVCVSDWMGVSGRLGLVPDGALVRLYAPENLRAFLWDLPPAVRVTWCQSPTDDAVGAGAPDPAVSYVYVWPEHVQIDRCVFAEARHSMMADGADRVDFCMVSGSDGKAGYLSAPAVGLAAYTRAAFVSMKPANAVANPRCVAVVDGVLPVFRGDAQPVTKPYTDIRVVNVVVGNQEPVPSDTGLERAGVVAKAMADPAEFLDVALCGPREFLEQIQGRVLSRSVWPDNQMDCELLVRATGCHWLAVVHSQSAVSWPDVLRVAAAREDRDLLLFPGVALVNPRTVRLMPPAMPDIAAWLETCRQHAHFTQFDADCTPMASGNKPVDAPKNPGALRVAVMSMCGVTGTQETYGAAEDRYGLGGEHQVVHWLRDSFLRRPEVVVCDIFDTNCVQMIEPGYYDLVLSNSCWKPSPRTAAGGTSIFWHFNTNANHADERTAIGLGYDHIWTNSPLSLQRIMAADVAVSTVHLNASSTCHGIYPYESKLFRHDCCYVGGYQTEYKGRDLLHSYIRVLTGHQDEFDFVIYGNRKWQVATQRQALKTDHGFFKEDDIDDSYEPHYRGVLHPHDFRILAKNCKVWVNFNSADQRPLDMVNDRGIWSQYCGAFLVTDDTPSQRALYGDICDYSDGGEPLVEKVRYWLSHDEERESKRSRAHGRISGLGLTTDGTVDKALALYAARKAAGQ